MIEPDFNRRARTQPFRPVPPPESVPVEVVSHTLPAPVVTVAPPIAAPATGPVVGQSYPITWNGQAYTGIYVGGGQYQIPTGNTNGNAVDMWGWLAWAIKNRQAKASAAWCTSETVKDWYRSQDYAHTFLNRIAPPVITAATLYGVGEGFAAAGAAGGAGAGAAPVADETVAPQVTFTGELAAPVATVDTGIVAETLPFVAAPVLAEGAAAVTAGDVAAHAVESTLIKGAAQVAAAKIIAAPVKPAADIVSHTQPPTASPKAAATSTDGKKLLLYGLALAVASQLL